MRVFGLSIIAVGLWVLAWDVEGWNTAWFLFAWVGWLVWVDGQIHALGAPSFLRERRRELGAMLLWQGGLAFTAFTTVLPACFFHAALLEAMGFDPRGPELVVRGGLEWAIGGLGLLCIGLPLIWPQWAFWMVWGALVGAAEASGVRPPTLAQVKIWVRAARGGGGVSAGRRVRPASLR